MAPHPPITGRSEALGGRQSEDRTVRSTVVAKFSARGESDRRFFLEPLLVHAFPDVVLLPLRALVGIRGGELHLFGCLGRAGRPGIVPRGGVLSTTHDPADERHKHPPLHYDPHIDQHHRLHGGGLCALVQAGDFGLRARMCQTIESACRTTGRRRYRRRT
jgi:hypothetical protein